MGYKSSSLLSLTVLLAFSSSIHGFDITKLLGQYPEFSQFNQYLTQTNLAGDINKRNTITVLALDNKALSPLSGKSQEAIKAIISAHVLLDYYDEKKLVEAQGSHQQLVTLFQASGLATNNQGFVYVSLINEGEIAFASAVQGAPFKSVLVRTVTTMPYNISILQVTEPIVAPGRDASAGSSQPSSSASSPPPAGAAKAPVASSTAASPPAEEVVAESPEEETAVAPAAEESSDDGATAPPPSSSSRTQIGFVGAVMALVSLFVSL